MENKELIKGEFSNANMLFKIIKFAFIILTIVAVIFLIATASDEDYIIGFIIAGALALILAVCFLITNYLIKASEVIIGTETIYGKSILGKQIYLPIKEVSAVSKGWFGKISIRTSSGRILFYFLENNDEIIEEVLKTI